MRKSILTSLILLLALAMTPQLNAEIFKWTDEYGRVHFTDAPPNGSNSKPVDIGPINTYGAPSKILIDETLSRPTGVKGKKDRVIIYSTTWCGVCTKAKNWLRQNKIAFSDYDVEKTDRGRNDYKKLNGRGVPIIKVGKQRMNGFSPASMKQMLRKAGYEI